LLADRLRQLRQAGGIVVMATHDFDTATGLVDRLICLREGRAREVAAGSGPLREQYRAAMSGAWS
jgi:energy-coupling factor transporter ATP-binding protein EcfA2